MKIPGFTAEASFYKISEHYQIFGIKHKAYRAVHPAGFMDNLPPWVKDFWHKEDLSEILPWPECGLIRGSRQEDRFIDCIEQCRSKGVTYSGCYRTCCKQLTGRPCCNIA